MYCSNCGTNIPEDVAACPSCNKPREGAAPSVDATQNTPPPPPPGYPPAGYPPPGYPAPKSGFTKFINFETMITPMIMKIVYLVGTGLIILGTLITMFSGFALGAAAGMMGFFGGLIGGAIGLVFFRVFCESLILFFSVHKELTQINKNTKK